MDSIAPPADACRLETPEGQADSPASMPGMEHRWGRRIACCATVRLTAGSGMTGTCRLRNVSMSGAYLETSLPLSLFAPVEIAVIREDGEDAPVLLASVVRKDGDGVAVEWTEVMPGPICPLLGCNLPCLTTASQRGWEPHSIYMAGCTRDAPEN